MTSVLLTLRVIDGVGARPDPGIGARKQGDFDPYQPHCNRVQYCSEPAQPAVVSEGPSAVFHEPPRTTCDIPDRAARSMGGGAS